MIDSRDKADKLLEDLKQLITSTSNLSSLHHELKEDSTFSVREFTDDECEVVKNELFENFAKIDAVALILRPGGTS